MKRLLQILNEEFGTGPTPWKLEMAQRIAARLPFLGFARTRLALYRWGGVRVGAGTILMGHVRCWGRAQLSIGSGCSLSGPLSINVDADVTIGDRVQIAHDLRILTVGHKIGPWEQRAGAIEVAPVHIGDGCWIGANVTILPGVRIGAGSIVSAGAVVTQDVPPDTVASGVPATPMPLPRALRRKPAVIDPSVSNSKDPAGVGVGSAAP